MYEHNLLYIVLFLTALFVAGWVGLLLLGLWGLVAPLVGLPAPPAGVWPH